MVVCVYFSFFFCFLNQGEKKQSCEVDIAGYPKTVTWEIILSTQLSLAFTSMYRNHTYFTSL